MSDYESARRADEDRDKLRNAYVRMRGVDSYDDAAVPIALRNLKDMHRIAEADARARHSPCIEDVDIKHAKRLVGASLHDYGQNEDGEFDADVREGGEGDMAIMAMSVETEKTGAERHRESNGAYEHVLRNVEYQTGDLESQLPAMAKWTTVLTVPGHGSQIGPETALSKRGTQRRQRCWPKMTKNTERWTLAVRDPNERGDVDQG
ncbi:hypothetical protein [Halomontanus rarus]|uniref:hypothetical protein n=1 Tax=Halomontanus rarus TaxID=3034020 RepID=UPI0023E8D45F|nr:hypothetical protein [Halovivax sp. TS33]